MPNRTALLDWFLALLASATASFICRPLFPQISQVDLFFTVMMSCILLNTCRIRDDMRQ